MKLPDKSIIVAAHPDDEILWFSSIIQKVDHILICFVGHKSRPDWTKGRQESLKQYPLQNMSCLGLEASETLNGADWNHPIATDIGIEIVNYRISSDKYVANFPRLRSELKNRLSGYQNVFTHNPWGEYGHEDHIQLYRAVKSLQSEMGFTIWYSGYFSNKSMVFMSKYASDFSSGPVTFRTDKDIANKIAMIYKKTGCWTWYEGYQWPDEESFIRDHFREDKNEILGTVFPLNMIAIEIPKLPVPPPKKNIFKRLYRKLSSLIS
ncbi:MAG: hypothetical protein C4522_13880 [Desulfobacteraceae bacterium]|nr:MAG: hypothetical protein C4522_13880 [Desulfobacteraceae bacterium]